MSEKKVAVSEIPFAAVVDGNEHESHPGLIVPWWSVTKTVLASACLRLVEQGRLQLDTPLKGRSYTLRQLLQHTAGLRSYGGPAYHDAVANSDMAWSIEDMLKRASSEKALFKPGDGWMYSNIGYLLVRQQIETTLDTDLGAALQTLVFDPLDLESPKVAYTQDDLDGVSGVAATYDPNWVYHGLIVGKLIDQARLLDRLSNGAFLSDDLFSQMRNPYRVGGAIAGRPWLTCNYGLGLMMGAVADIGETYGHSGVGPGSVCSAYHLTRSQQSICVATFTRGPDEAVCENELVRVANVYLEN